MSDDQRIHQKNASQRQEKGGKELSRVEEEGGLNHPPQIQGSVVLLHDWLNGARGGEIVFESLLDLFPSAEVMTLFYEPEKCSKRLSEKLKKRKVHTSVLNSIPFFQKHYRYLFPLLPFFLGRFSRRLHQLKPSLVISSTHCVIKGVTKPKDSIHVAYVHAPMRYIWDRFEDYFAWGKVSMPVRLAALCVRPFLQLWDRLTSNVDRIDVVIANSHFIAEEIKRVWRRKDVQVVHPFARLERFSRPRNGKNFYLMVGAFAPYKKTDLAIRAFANTNRTLKIVGDGQDEKKLKALVDELGAKNIHFLGNPSNEEIEKLYSECFAFIFPGKEDFGITPLEAMAAGAPVMAYRAGGACETVTEKTGVFFSEQTEASLLQAILKFESDPKSFSAEECRAQAQHFTEKRFQTQILEILRKIQSSKK